MCCVLFQIIDGQQVEVMPGDSEEEDEEDEEEEMMAVEGQDGQQYVVLEVIQLQVRPVNKFDVLFNCKTEMWVFEELCNTEYLSQYL